MTGPKDDLVKAILHEHAALRTEIIFSLGQRASIGSYGLAAISVLTAATVASFTPLNDRIVKFAPAVILGLIVPLVCHYTLYLWNNETKRIRRASQYIFHIEKRLNETIGDKALYWESFMRQYDQGPVFSPVNYITTLFYTSISFVSVTFSLLYLNALGQIGYLAAQYAIGATCLAYAGIFWVELRRSRLLVTDFASPAKFRLQING